MKKIIFRILIVLIAASATLGGYRFVRQFQQKQQIIPTAKVLQGDVVIRSYTRGELRAVRSVTLTAPNLFGTIQITQLAALGSFAREKDLIVEFDDSEVQSRLEEDQLELEQLDEQIKKAQAELDMRNNQDQVDLMTARYNVRRSELEVKRNELLSAIDQKRNLLNLDEANRRLKQLSSDIKSRLEQSEAEIAVLREKRNKAVLNLQREQMRLLQAKLLAPMAGLVAIRTNRPTGGMFYRGMQLPDLREGDQIFPGTPVADVLDLSELEVAAKVGELDRANLYEGQDASIRLDAVPEKLFHGKIKMLSGTASANIYSGDPAKKFDVVFSIDMKELLTGLGVKPEQIRTVLETAARNRNKPVMKYSAPVMPDLNGSPGGMGAVGGGMGAVGGGMGAAGGGTGMASVDDSSQDQGAVRRGGARGGLGGAQMSTEERQKMREAMQKALNGRNLQDLSQEERQKLFAQVRGGTGGSRPGAGGGAGTQTPAVGFSRGPGGGGGPAEPPAAIMPGGTSQFSAKDLENARLPAAPEEESQLDVLLRPGLLSDVEIIVEKVPNAIHVPMQSVFDVEGKPVVYVKTGETFDPRPIQPLKRSESVMVVAAGVKPGEIVALADPTAKKGSPEKQKEKGGKKGSGMPSGTKGGGQ